MAYAHPVSKGMTLENGRQQPLSSFAKAADPAHALDDLPAGYVGAEAASGLAVLKKQAAAGQR